ncbi:MAG: MATE family efflux transporter [Clostridia bacterium]|nr:MATE family efflux transporter [Clostridia bacterium]
MQRDLTQGPIRRGLILFSLPLIAGNLLQQLYNIVDTWVVGRFLGNVALAAVGSAFSLMVLLTSLLLGLCMGSGVVFSQLHGEGRPDRMKTAVVNAFVMIALIALLLTVLSYAALPALLSLMRIPPEVVSDITAYLRVVFAGIPFVFLYNFLAAVLRSVGNSLAPLLFLLVSTLANIVLDLLFVLGLHAGVAGAAAATVMAQALSAVGIALCFLRMTALHPGKAHMRRDGALLARIASVSVLTSVQQSIMNFGILMIQSLVNSFGVANMAAFAAGVKIDAFAYSPAQDFANGFATFVAQNTGAGKPDRVRRGLREAGALSLSFCLLVSALVFLFAKPLLTLFIDPAETEILAIGARYLRLEGVFYVGIGMLFLLYATYRGLERAGMSVVLTVISLGLRVLIAYAFAPRFGVTAIWLAIPIGWFVADAVGLFGLVRAWQKGG